MNENKITKEDIEWWERHLSLQHGTRHEIACPFVEQLLKLAKAVKELQEKK